MNDNPVDDRSYIFENSLDKKLNSIPEPTYNLTAFGVAVAAYGSMLLLSALRPEAQEAIQNVLLSYGAALGALYAGKYWEERRADQAWLAAEEKRSQREVIDLTDRIAKNKKNNYSKS